MLLGVIPPSSDWGRVLPAPSVPLPSCPPARGARAASESAGVWAEPGPPWQGSRWMCRESSWAVGIWPDVGRLSGSSAGFSPFLCSRWAAGARIWACGPVDGVCLTCPPANSVLSAFSELCPKAASTHSTEEPGAMVRQGSVSSGHRRPARVGSRWTCPVAAACPGFRGECWSDSVCFLARALDEAWCGGHTDPGGGSAWPLPDQGTLTHDSSHASVFSLQ